MSDMYEFGQVFAVDEEEEIGEKEVGDVSDEELDEESFEDEDEDELPSLAGEEDEEGL